VNIGVNEGWVFAIFSPENQPVQRHAAKLAEKFVGKPFYKNDYVERMSGNDLERSAQFLHKHFVFVSPSDDELTIDAVLGKIRQMVLRRGIKGAVIDPWNELDHQRPAGISETEYISSAITKIRRFARECNIHIWLVAHPTKLQKDKATGQYPVPTLYDISGSAHWRNKADNGIVVYREIAKGSKEVEVHVQKIRFKEIGKVGIAVLEYNYANGRYKDPDGKEDYELPD
jgi:twinkle protein